MLNARPRNNCPFVKSEIGMKWEHFGFHVSHKRSALVSMCHDVSHKRSALVSECPKLALLCKDGLHKMKCPNAFLPNLLRYKYLLIIRLNAEMFSNRQTRRPVLNFSVFSSSWAFRFAATIFILCKPSMVYLVVVVVSVRAPQARRLEPTPEAHWEPQGTPDHSNRTRFIRRASRTRTRFNRSISIL